MGLHPRPRRRSLPRAARPRPDGGRGRSGDRESRLQPDEPQAPRARAAAAVTSRMDARGPGRGARRRARSHVACADGDTQGGVRRERSRLVWRGPEGPRHTSRHDGRCEELRMARAYYRDRLCQMHKQPAPAHDGGPRPAERSVLVTRRGTSAYPHEKRSDARWASRSHRSCPRSPSRIWTGPSSFYSDTLGLSVRKLEGEMDDAPSPRSAIRTVFSCTRAPTAAARPPTRASSVEDVESTVRDLRDKGVSFEEYDFPGLKTVNGIATTGRPEDRLVQGQRGQHPRHRQRAGRGHAQGRLT